MFLHSYFSLGRGAVGSCPFLQGPRELCGIGVHSRICQPWQDRAVWGVLQQLDRKALYQAPWAPLQHRLARASHPIPVGVLGSSPMAAEFKDKSSLNSNQQGKPCQAGHRPSECGRAPLSSSMRNSQAWPACDTRASHGVAVRFHFSMWRERNLIAGYPASGTSVSYEI